MLGSAPTGTGKTAAYLLPVLQHLLDFPRKKSGPPRILILDPDP
ncbi:DEAD/DEAH box helicase [Enterobacter hormaechei]